MRVELPASRLPRDSEYWRRLEQRLHDDAVEPLAAYAMPSGSWYGVLAQRAHWLVAASAAAMLLLWWALPRSEAIDGWQWIERSVEPTEIAGALIAGPAPPSVDTLMRHFPPMFDASFEGEPRP